MLIGDSAIIGELKSGVLDGQDELAVVANPFNGNAAVGRLKCNDIDVVIMDIGMKEAEGVDTLPALFRADAEVKVIIVSTLSFSNVKAAMKGLLEGAAEFVALPSPSRRLNKARIGGELRGDLIATIKSLGLARRKTGRETKAAAAVVLRRHTITRPDVIAIGSSTGGPKALLDIFKRLPTNIKQPVLITQHLPAAFTVTLAASITRESRWKCVEGKDGEEIQKGTVYLAPGGFHMEVVSSAGGKKLIRLNNGPPVNFCKPSVDPMFLSIAKAYGPGVLALMLTGMGRDGFDGGKAVVNAGGTVIAQDEDSSIVWGMPGAVAMGGLCSAVLPLKDIPSYLRKAATGAKA